MESVEFDPEMCAVASRLVVEAMHPDDRTKLLFNLVQAFQFDVGLHGVEPQIIEQVRAQFNPPVFCQVDEAMLHHITWAAGATLNMLPPGSEDNEVISLASATLGQREWEGTI